MDRRTRCIFFYPEKAITFKGVSIHHQTPVRSASYKRLWFQCNRWILKGLASVRMVYGIYGAFAVDIESKPKIKEIELDRTCESEEMNYAVYGEDL